MRGKVWKRLGLFIEEGEEKRVLGVWKLVKWSLKFLGFQLQ